jgi:hypothetical protein
MLIPHINDLDKALEVNLEILGLENDTELLTYPRKYSVYTESEVGDFVAIATVEGPVLLHAGHCCLLSDPSWTIEVQKGDVHNTVHFNGLHGETFSFNHPRYIPAAWDIWDDEDINDFFLWVENMKNKKHGLFDSFTLKR